VELQNAAKQLILKDGVPRWDRLESLLDVALESNDYDVIEALELVYSYVINPENELLRKNIFTQAVALLDTAAASSMGNTWQLMVTAADNIASSGAVSANIRGNMATTSLPSIKLDVLLNDVTRQGLSTASELISSNLSMASESNRSAIKTVSKILKVLAARRDLDVNKLSAMFVRVSFHLLLM
jgi:hypothetical protein